MSDTPAREPDADAPRPADPDGGTAVGPGDVPAARAADGGTAAGPSPGAGESSAADPSPGAGESSAADPSPGAGEARRTGPAPAGGAGTTAAPPPSPPPPGRRIDWSRVALSVAAPLAAIVFACALISVILLVTGKNPAEAFSLMATKGLATDSQIFIIDRATTYFLAGLAVALGFRMNLFNIGVDGQYRMAAMLAAVAGSAVALPGPLHIAFVLVVAMGVGGLFAGIAAVLKVTRGVNEVISSIMLNTIATNLIAWMLTPSVFGVLAPGSNDLKTKTLPKSAWFPGIDRGPVFGTIWGFVFVAALVGVVYWFLLARTRFGFDLRATGRSMSASAAGGTNVKKMVLSAMVLSGAIAGLVGMPELLNDSHNYSLDFPTGIGFTGISIALLGRNNPVGIGLAALLWAFLDRVASPLDFHGFPKEIVTIMQAVIVIAVVVAYEVVGRYARRRQQRQIGRELAAAAAANPRKEAAV